MIACIWALNSNNKESNFIQHNTLINTNQSISLFMSFRIFSKNHKSKIQMQIIIKPQYMNKNQISKIQIICKTCKITGMNDWEAEATKSYSLGEADTKAGQWKCPWKFRNKTPLRGGDLVSV